MVQELLTWRNKSPGDIKSSTFGPLLDTLEQKVLVVDELEARLHPVLTLQSFACSILLGDPNNAAHLYTPDTRLLGGLYYGVNLVLLKKIDGATALYSLAGERPQ